MNLLEKLRNKSQSEKSKLLWITVGVASTIVFLVWLVVMPKDYLANKDERNKHLDNLKGGIQGTFSGQEFDELRDSVDKLKNIDHEMIQSEGISDKPSDDSQAEVQPENPNNTGSKNRLPLEE